MSKRPLIGITAGEVVNTVHTWAPVVYGQMHTYVNAVIKAGGVPVILPLTDQEDIWKALFERCDGLLFAGGNDIHPSFYGEPVTGARQDTLSTLRDAHELALMRLSLQHQKPLLAICRGMQLLNVAHGGSLYQDILTDLPQATDHEISNHNRSMAHVAHRIKIEPNSKLRKIIRAGTVSANSHHHQAIKKLGKDLQVNAWADDGIVEGVELPGDHFVLGVQLHPEGLAASTEPRWQRLFTAFVGAAGTS